MYLNSVIAWMSRNTLLETGAIFEILSDCNGTWFYNDLVPKRNTQLFRQSDQLTQLRCEC